jgi:hypothetical protein
MDTITIQVLSPNAYKLLEDMEELGLIKILKGMPKLSSLRSKVKTNMTTEEIDEQLSIIRKEWERGF